MSSHAQVISVVVSLVFVAAVFQVSDGLPVVWCWALASSSA
jgi:hypothetical protein